MTPRQPAEPGSAEQATEPRGTALGLAGGAVIGDADLAVVRSALRDAIAWREHTHSRSGLNRYYELARLLDPAT